MGWRAALRALAGPDEAKSARVEVGPYPSNDPFLPSVFADADRLAGRPDWAAEAGHPWTSAVVMVALGWYARNLLQADPAVFTKVGDEDTPDPDHPQVEALGDDTAGPDGQAATLQLSLISDLCWGETFLVWSEAAGGGGRYRWVSPEFPGARWFIRPVKSRAKYIDGFEYWNDGKLEKKYRPDEVVYIQQMPDPLNPTRGMSALRSGLVALVGLARADVLAAGYLKAGTAKKAILVPGYQVDDAEAATIQRQLTIPLDDPSRVALANVPEGAQVVDIGAMAADLGITENTERFVAIVLALLGLSDMALGLNIGDTRSTFNNVREAGRAAVQGGLASWMARFGRGLTTDLPRFGAPEDAWTYFDTTRAELFHHDFAEKVANFNALFTSLYGPRNACAALCGLPTVDGPAGELYHDGSDGQPKPPSPSPIELMRAAAANGKPNGDGAAAFDEGEDDDA